MGKANLWSRQKKPANVEKMRVRDGISAGSFALPVHSKIQEMSTSRWNHLWESKGLSLAFAIIGIMSTLIIYGLMQEKIMRVPYGGQDYFKFSLFIVFCNRVLTCVVSFAILLFKKKAIGPVAPMHKYAAISISNILTTTCQYEALKYVSFPVQTLAKCAKMIPVMVWSTVIMQKRYGRKDYLLAVLVTMGCSIFILYQTGDDVSPYNKGKESTFWGILLMSGYLGFDGFTSTFQDKLFKGYNMEIYNQIFYVTLCSCGISMFGLLAQGHWSLTMAFIQKYPECLSDIFLLSMVAMISQFFISYTIRTFGALIFATIMTTRQFVSIMLSCLWYIHPLSWQQWAGSVLVFSSLYYKSLSAQSKKEVSTGDNKQEKILQEVEETLLKDGKPHERKATEQESTS